MIKKDTMNGRPALGKGLASLIPTTSAAPTPTPVPTDSASAHAPSGATAAGRPIPAPETGKTETSKDRVQGLSMVAIDEIKENPYQPRRNFEQGPLEELASSIRENGVIQPLVVRKTSNGYELIAGERRLRASKLAGLKYVPVVLRKTTDKESLELAIIENIQRENLNCVDEALAYFQLNQEFGLSQEEIAKQVGKERATVANFLRLLKLPEEVLEDLRVNRLSFGHAKTILSIEKPEDRIAFKDACLNGFGSVRESERQAQEWNKSSAPAAEAKKDADAKEANPFQADPQLNAVRENLIRSLSTKVEIKGNPKKGKILLHYSSREQLEGLLDKLLTNKWV
jgi:ParB family chromosome partitioning protein